MTTNDRYHSNWPHHIKPFFPHEVNTKCHSYHLPEILPNKWGTTRILLPTLVAPWPAPCSVPRNPRVPPWPIGLNPCVTARGKSRPNPWCSGTWRPHLDSLGRFCGMGRWWKVLHGKWMVVSCTLLPNLDLSVQSPRTGHVFFWVSRISDVMSKELWSTHQFWDTSWGLSFFHTFWGAKLVLFCFLIKNCCFIFLGAHPPDSILEQHGGYNQPGLFFPGKPTSKVAVRAMFTMAKAMIASMTPWASSWHTSISTCGAFDSLAQWMPMAFQLNMNIGSIRFLSVRLGMLGWLILKVQMIPRPHKLTLESLVTYLSADYSSKL